VQESHSQERSGAKTQAERAYHFFTDRFRDGRRFLLSELQASSGYKPNTVENYISKKWYWFLSANSSSYQVKDLFQGYTLAQFLGDLKQKRPEPVEGPIISDRAVCLIFLLGVILWWYRVSRRYRVKIWHLSFPL
jgi:hypothetical protein